VQVAAAGGVERRRLGAGGLAGYAGELSGFVVDGFDGDLESFVFDGARGGTGQSSSSPRPAKFQ
jgi:hypothetical protein